jgi:hypothetical protein
VKITKNCLRKLLREAIDDAKILPERPWSVEYTFSMSGGTASDSEGEAPDGFVVTMKGDSGLELQIVVDAYWNPSAGDQSGNSLKVMLDGEDLEDASSYVPTRFDDGKKQRLIISNSPVGRSIVVSHAPDEKSPPIAYLVFGNPFDDQEDVEFDADPIGNGEIDVELTNSVNV